MADAPEYCYSLDFRVRDYEVDMFGVVNHAVYPHYFEHTRHSFLAHLGAPIADLRRSGWNPVVTRLEVDYKTPLLSGDDFTVGVSVLALTRVRFEFLQDIRRHSDGAHTTRARVVGTVLSPSGRPRIPPEFEALRPFLKVEEA